MVSASIESATVAPAATDAAAHAADERRWALLRRSGLLEVGDDEPFDRVARLARDLLEVDTALVSLLDEDRQVLRGRVGLRPDLAQQRETDLARSYCKYPVATGEPFVVSDARESALLRASPAISERGAVSYAGAPLSLSDGTVLGTLCVLNASPREWSPDDLSMLAQLADVVESELERQLQQSRMDHLIALAERLPEPMFGLGHTIRTVATLVEHPGDPRLPRVADSALRRLGNVEVLAQDLTTAARSERASEDELTTVDIVVELRRIVSLAGSAARPGDLEAHLCAHPVEVEAQPRALSRGLTLAVTTLLHHLTEGLVTVELTEGVPDHPVVTVTLAAEGTELPASDVLRVVGHLASAGGGDPSLDVRYGRASVRVRSDVVAATAGPDGTRLVVCLPASSSR